MTKALWDDWVGIGGTTHRQTLLAFLMAIPSTKKYLSLSMQLFLCLGARLDALLVQELEAASCQAGPSVHVKDATVGQSNCHDVVMEGRLMKHTRASRLACRDQLHFSYAGDSSRVGHLGILNGIMVMPSNVAFSMPPQVDNYFIKFDMEFSLFGLVSRAGAGRSGVWGAKFGTSECSEAL
jgi:hypothetical protein